MMMMMLAGLAANAVRTLVRLPRRQRQSHRGSHRRCCPSKTRGVTLSRERRRRRQQRSCRAARGLPPAVECGGRSRLLQKQQKSAELTVPLPPSPPSPPLPLKPSWGGRYDDRVDQGRGEGPPWLRRREAAAWGAAAVGGGGRCSAPRGRLRPAAVAAPCRLPAAAVVEKPHTCSRWKFDGMGQVVGGELSGQGTGCSTDTGA